MNSDEHLQNVLRTFQRVKEHDGHDTPTKDPELQRLSELAKVFSSFRDGWRNYVAHAKVRCVQNQAMSVPLHVQAFMVGLTGALADSKRPQPAP